MKIIVVDNNSFILYLNKYYTKDLNFEDEHHIEKYFKQIFIKLKQYYHLDIYGYYNIKVYVNDVYGIIMEATKLNSDYFKIYNSKVDMKIVIEINSLVLYEIEDYFLIDLFKEDIKNIFYFNYKYYFTIDKNININKYNLLMEYSRLVYADEVNKILTCAIEL
jgi:hypothetical protein